MKKDWLHLMAASVAVGCFLLQEQFPNEDSLERYVCSFYCDYNQTMYRRVHKGFKECRSELEAMFM